MTKRPAIFLDRDGTLIEEVDYLSRIEDLRLFSFSNEAIERLRGAGFLIVVVTNQSGIGRGIYTEADMHTIHEAIQQELSGAIDRFYFCPHLPCDGCDCRKPKTGMIEAAIRDLGLDVKNSWMIGDKKTDVETGQLAGIRTALVLTGYGTQHKDLLERRPELVAGDLSAAAAEIVRISNFRAQI